jgi:ERCC4-type nuclease
MLVLASTPGLRLLHSRSPKETAALIGMLAVRAAASGDPLDTIWSGSAGPGTDGAPSPEREEAIAAATGFLMSLPGISWPRAHGLARQHATVAAAVAALIADPTTPAARALLTGGRAETDAPIDIDAFFVD